MGRKPGGLRRTFVGESFLDDDGPATLEDALLAAAELAVSESFVRPKVDDDPKSGPLWFDIASLEVEIANQHIKTMRVKVTER